VKAGDLPVFLFQFHHVVLDDLLLLLDLVWTHSENVRHVSKKDSQRFAVLGALLVRLNGEIHRLYPVPTRVMIVQSMAQFWGLEIENNCILNKTLTSVAVFECSDVVQTLSQFFHCSEQDCSHEMREHSGAMFTI
jgi:hypothetical protein